MQILAKTETAYERYCRMQDKKFYPSYILSAFYERLQNKLYDFLFLTKEEAERKYKIKELELLISYHSTMCEECKEKANALERHRQEVLSILNFNPHILSIDGVAPEVALLDIEETSSRLKADHKQHMRLTELAYIELLKLTEVRAYA